jgi:hypothetical protein
MDLKAAFDLFKSAKAYVATLVALGGILLTLSADENFKSLGIPDTFVGKMAGIGTLLVTFGAVFGVRNIRTVEQAQEDLEIAKNRVAGTAKKTSVKALVSQPKKVARKKPAKKAPRS